jgi:GNAT superfamily N-acetyltransferase
MFELSDEIVRQVIFGMENQNNRYVVDVSDGRVVREDTLDVRPERDMYDPTASYYPLPEWKSSDGFQLMQRFLTELPNPHLRSELNDILLSGKRVFRRFKDRLSEHPEAQRRYYGFKFLEMRNHVIEWYNTIREIRGLDALEIGIEDDLGDLILTDIVIESAADGEAGDLAGIDRQAFDESMSELPPDVADFVYARNRASRPAVEDPRSIVLVARNPIGDICGYLWAFREELVTERTVVTIVQLYVMSDYRRLGIAGALLDRCEQMCDRIGAAVVLGFDGALDHRTEVLERRGYIPLGAAFVRATSS